MYSDLFLQVMLYHGRSFAGFAEDYKETAKRIQRRYGVPCPSAVFDLDEVEEFLTYKKSKWKSYMKVYSRVSTEMFTRPSSPSSHCTHVYHFNPPRDIPEQL